MKYTYNYTHFLCSSPIYFYLDQIRAKRNERTEGCPDKVHLGLGCAQCFKIGFASEIEWLSHVKDRHQEKRED